MLRAGGNVAGRGAVGGGQQASKASGPRPPLPLPGLGQQLPQRCSKPWPWVPVQS